MEKAHLKKIKLCLSFIVYLFVLNCLISDFATKFFERPFRSFIRFNAHTVSTLLNAVDVSNTVKGNTIWSKQTGLEIIDECTGILILNIYLAGILAFPVSFKKKILGVLLGIPIIFLFNILRIFSLFLIIRWHHDYFDLFHGFVWNYSYTPILIVTYLIWLRSIHYERAI